MQSPPGCSGSPSLLQEPCCCSSGCLLPLPRELCLAHVLPCVLGAAPAPSQQTAALNAGSMHCTRERCLRSLLSTAGGPNSLLGAQGCYQGVNLLPAEDLLLWIQALLQLSILTPSSCHPPAPDTPEPVSGVTESECQHRHRGVFCFPKTQLHTAKLLSACASPAPPQDPAWARCSG